MNAAQIRFVVSSHSAVRVMVAVKGLVAMIRAAMILAAVVLVAMIRAVVTVMILQQNVMRDVMAHTAARDHAATTRAEQIVTVNRENARQDVMDLMALVVTRRAAIILAGANVTANKPSVKRDVKDQMEIVATQRAAMILAEVIAMILGRSVQLGVKVLIRHAAIIPEVRAARTLVELGALMKE